MSGMIEVLQPGFGTTIQDRGRRGHRHEGIPQSGWLDASLAAAANALVGNGLGGGSLINAADAATTLGRAWDFVARMASNAFDALGRGMSRLLDGAPLEEQLKQLPAPKEVVPPKPLPPLPASYPPLEPAAR